MKSTTRGKGAASKKETLKPVDEGKVGKRKAAPAPKADKSIKKKGKPAKKDPNKPKRPPSAFFVFLEEFRVTFKKEHPDVKGVGPVGKAGGEKWKSMSAAEKAPYEAKAAKRKADYDKEVTAYNKKQQESAEAEDESDKSKSEISDKDDEESGEGEDGEEDDDEEEDEEE